VSHALDIFKICKNKSEMMKIFYSDKKEFWNNCKDERFESGNDYPCLYDKNSKIPFEPHYFYHPAWACRVLQEINPEKHVDISSIMWMSGCLSAFFPIEYYEFQPPDIKLDNFKVSKIDLCDMIFDDLSVSSLSCLHVLEHVGLGRYGDRIDPAGDIKAASELSRVLAHGGHLLFVTVIAESARIEFNAHRVYTHAHVLELFPDLELAEFSLILDDPVRGLIRYADVDLLKGQKFACGCYHFVRK
jgi:SAM-dependent methyltransferase